MKVIVDDFEFDFPQALDAYKFDEIDKNSPHYHGITQFKSVDVMVELPTQWLWIEIKHYRRAPSTDQKISELTWSLARKFRDTYLYRLCEKVPQKELFYICLMNFDAALLLHFRKELQYKIPTGLANPNRWKMPLLEDSHLIVVNERMWNQNGNILRWGKCKYLGKRRRKEQYE